MAYCPSCGAPAEGKFCAKCGATVPGGAPGASQPSPAAGTASNLAPNVAASLSYIPILIPAILFLVWAPYSRDKAVRFHAWQSLFLQIAWIVAGILLSIVIPMISWRLWITFGQVLNLAVVLLAIFLMWKSYKGEKVVLPVIGEMAQKQA
jgi:uncharacterized membrane protein